MTKALHSFCVGHDPAIDVRVYPHATAMHSAIARQVGWCPYHVAGCFVEPLKQPRKIRTIGTVFLHSGQLNLSTIVHEVTHALQTHSLHRYYNLREECDRETHAHWLANTVEDLIAELLRRGHQWIPKRSRGAIFNLGLNLSLSHAPRILQQSPKGRRRPSRRQQTSR